MRTRMVACNTPGCGTLVETTARATKCDEHRRQADAKRGSRQQRGYGAEHTRLRAQLLPDAYGQECIHCGQRMWPHEALALDHTEDRTAYRGIVHASCNNRDGAARGNRDRTP